VQLSLPDSATIALIIRHSLLELSVLWPAIGSRRTTKVCTRRWRPLCRVGRATGAQAGAFRAGSSSRRNRDPNLLTVDDLLGAVEEFRRKGRHDVFQSHRTDQTDRRLGARGRAAACGSHPGRHRRQQQLSLTGAQPWDGLTGAARENALLDAAKREGDLTVYSAFNDEQAMPTPSARSTASKSVSTTPIRDLLRGSFKKPRE